jgi:DNA-directed RNA polymerase subunit RPC12/RpoP
MAETYSNAGAECPYCGHMHHPSDSDGALYDESTCEYECGDCLRTFQLQVYVSHSWTCKTIGEPDAG